MCKFRARCRTWVLLRCRLAVQDTTQGRFGSQAAQSEAPDSGSVGTGRTAVRRSACPPLVVIDREMDIQIVGRQRSESCSAVPTLGQVFDLERHKTIDATHQLVRSLK